MTLLYKPDSEEAFDRLTRWWKGGDLGRPAVQLTVPRAAPHEDILALPLPEGWTTHYSTKSFEYRLNQAARSCIGADYMAEAIPSVSPDMGANSLALYLGCQGVDGDDTVWFIPCIADPEEARFAFDPGNFYWDFTLRLAREQLRFGQGKFLTSFPDLIEGLDTLAAMRDSQPLLVDLIERPGWVRRCLDQITELYFQYYEALYEMIKDARGGSVYWAWAPGRLSKLQCDFSAMISPGMFREFMLPVLLRMTERLDYAIYHLDGPSAIRHVDALLSIPRLNVIQWTAGAGAEPTSSPKWWPLYHRIIEGGKKIMIHHPDAWMFLRLKAEFGADLKQFILQGSVGTLPEGEHLLDQLQC